MVSGCGVCQAVAVLPSSQHTTNQPPSPLPTSPYVCVCQLHLHLGSTSKAVVVRKSKFCVSGESKLICVCVVGFLGFLSCVSSRFAARAWESLGVSEWESLNGVLRWVTSCNDVFHYLPNHTITCPTTQSPK